MKISREDGIAPYFMKVLEIRDQLQELGEIMPDKEMTTIVLNTFPEEWGNFTSNILEIRKPTYSMNFGHCVKLKKLG